MNYTNYYAIDSERFFITPSDGIVFIGFSEEITYNFDPGSSDFCELKAGYIRKQKLNSFEGNWEINSDCHLVFTYTNRDPFVYVGSKFKPISKHYIEEVREAGPDGGESLRRVYEMTTAIRQAEETHVRRWYD